MDFQGVGSIRVGREGFALGKLSARRAGLTESLLTVVSILNNLPVKITTTMGAILVVASEKFPYRSTTDELTAYGVCIVPLAGRILRVERQEAFVNQGVVSDLTCAPERMGFTEGEYYHAEIYYWPQKNAPPVIPPSWLNEKTPTM